MDRLVVRSLRTLPLIRIFAGGLEENVGHEASPLVAEPLSSPGLNPRLEKVGLGEVDDLHPLTGVLHRHPEGSLRHLDVHQALKIGALAQNLS